MAIDRADWHYGGDYPKGLPDENGGTHIGMYLSWVILHNLEGDLAREDFEDEVALVRARKMTGRDYLFRCCDEKFTDEDLNEEGLAFTRSYYADEDGDFGKYITEYEKVFCEFPSTYHVDDTWANYDILEPVITKAYTNWKKSKK